ncbi:sortase domain-bontaining protein [Streptomyces sp. NPDC053367]|uniref:class F sortase n=1 Tax=Streptomyces sp. NPDC053367 TaxID=3365700 RepID=UPI0037D7D9F2
MLLAVSGAAVLALASPAGRLPAAADFDARTPSVGAPPRPLHALPPAASPSTAFPPSAVPPAGDRASVGGPATATTPEQASAVPRRVDMPRVGLSAAVEPVGVAADGSARIPRDPDRVGWYRYGPAPGDPTGSAVLMGHVDSRTGALGAFAALFDVRAGDEVTVRRATGTPVTYRVVARATVDKDRLPAQVFTRSGDPLLTMITCAPPFDRDQGGYQRNLVVTAVARGAR